MLHALHDNARNVLYMLWAIRLVGRTVRMSITCKLLLHIVCHIYVCYIMLFDILIDSVGRAGRDGLPSKAVLLYKSDDVNRLRFIMNKDNASDDGRPGFMLSQEDQEVYSCIYMRVYILLQYEMITRSTGYKLYIVCGT
jgi:hypothetical protein